jgi:uncharacterized protein YegL
MKNLPQKGWGLFLQEKTMSDMLLDQAEFADNPEPRCPVVLVLDTSQSMYGEPIHELNQGLRAFSEALKGDSLAALRVEVAIITFGGEVKVYSGVDAVEVEDAMPDMPVADAQPFVTIDYFQPPELAPAGNTPMGEAVERSLDLIHQRKEMYKQNSIDYFRPWIFLITDGYPTDAWETAARQVREESQRKGVLFFSVGVERADMNILAQFSDELRPPLKLKGLAFGELFQWLSKSLSAVAHSRPGDQAPLPAVGWAQVDTSH